MPGGGGAGGRGVECLQSTTYRPPGRGLSWREHIFVELVMFSMTGLLNLSTQNRRKFIIVLLNAFLYAKDTGLFFS